MDGNIDMNMVMRQAKKMQGDLLRAQEKLAATEFEATAGGGAIYIKINGKKEILELKILPEIVDPSDIETLQDAITSAVSEVIKQADEAAANELGKLTGGLNPGAFYLLVS